MSNALIPALSLPAVAPRDRNTYSVVLSYRRQFNSYSYHSYVSEYHGLERSQVRAVIDECVAHGGDTICVSRGDKTCTILALIDGVWTTFLGAGVTGYPRAL